LERDLPEDNAYNLRRVMLAPGTGPFKHVRRIENEIWVLEKKKDYWNAGLPYLDGLEFYNLVPFSPELGSAIISGRIDYGRVFDPVTLRRAKATPEISGTLYNQSVIQGTYVNSKRKPLDDPRVRRAFHLALDRPVLIDVVKDVAPMRMGGFIYPFSEYATPPEELAKRPGYQTDSTAAIKEARQLMAAAGYGNGAKGLDFLVRDLASFRLWSQAMQAMLAQALNVEIKLRNVVESVWFDDVANGNFDLAIGAVVSTLLDPSDYFNAWYRTGGPQNYSGWSNPKFDALADQIDRELDPAKRKALAREAEVMFEADPPVLPIAWEQLADIWYNYVKGHNPYNYFGAYDVTRWDMMWLDK
jgi:ABC-type oligopeptide transport system substrate-binding subunit